MGLMVNYLKYTELEKARVIFAVGLDTQAVAMFTADGIERELDEIQEAFGLTAGESLRIARRAARAHYVTIRKQGDLTYIKGDQYGVLKAREILKIYSQCIRSN